MLINWSYGLEQSTRDYGKISLSAKRIYNKCSKGGLTLILCSNLNGWIQAIALTCLVWLNQIE